MRLVIMSWTFSLVMSTGIARADHLLLDFYADWCGPCKQMAPVVGNLERAGVKVRKVNVDREPRLKEQYGVSTIPCFVMLVDGREVGRLTGSQTQQAMTSLVYGAIKSDEAARAAATASAVKVEREKIAKALKGELGNIDVEDGGMLGEASEELESRATEDRARKEADYLVAIGTVGRGGLKPFAELADNPLTAEKVALGRQLFFEKRLSADATVSCATCHVPERAFTDGRQKARGIGGQAAIRNAPTICNACYKDRLMHDGRFLTLEGQVVFPIEDRAEMGFTLQGAVTRLRQIPTYRQEFIAAFGRDVTAGDIAKAIACFERTLVSYDAPIDRYAKGETWAFTAQQERGYRLFSSIGCTQCHLGQDFRDGLFHNTSASVGERDQGRFTITQQRRNFKEFATPTLRNLGLTNPYMHNGRFATLGEVVAFYNQGGFRDNTGNKDARIRPLGLNAQQQIDLAEFLRHGFNGTFPRVTRPAMP